MRSGKLQHVIERILAVGSAISRIASCAQISCGIAYWYTDVRNYCPHCCKTPDSHWTASHMGQSSLFFSVSPQ